MKLRKLARLCEHEELKEHQVAAGGYDKHPHYSPDWVTCPGGVFLPDDTLVIEKENGDWPGWAQIGGWSLDYLDALAAVWEAPTYGLNEWRPASVREAE